jgi:hypothetical protein
MDPVSLGQVQRLVDAFGAPAAAFALMAGILLWILLRQHRETRGERDKVLDVLQGNAKAQTELAGAVKDLSNSVESSSIAYTGQIDRIVRVFESGGTGRNELIVQSQTRRDLPPSKRRRNTG